MISEIIGNVRIPDAGKDSSGIRKAVGKDRPEAKIILIRKRKN